MTRSPTFAVMWLALVLPACRASRFAERSRDRPDPGERLRGPTPPAFEFLRPRRRGTARGEVKDSQRCHPAYSGVRRTSERRDRLGRPRRPLCFARGRDDQSQESCLDIGVLARRKRRQHLRRRAQTSRPERSNHGFGRLRLVLNEGDHGGKARTPAENARGEESIRHTRRGSAVESE